MRDMDEFQDMLYKDENSSVQHLLPPRRRKNNNKGKTKKPEISEAQKRIQQIDSEVHGYLIKSKIDREESADI